MNNYGMVIQEFGLQDLFTRIVRDGLHTLASVLFPEWMAGIVFDSQHAFIVEYALEKDKDLDLHMDESLITVNVNLGKQFEGGAVVFSG